MTNDRLEIALRGFTRRRPFRRFVIEMMSGDRFLVTHPEAVGRRGEVFLHRSPEDTHRVFDGECVCQLMDEVAANP